MLHTEIALLRNCTFNYGSAFANENRVRMKTGRRFASFRCVPEERCVYLASPATNNRDGPEAKPAAAFGRADEVEERSNDGHVKPSLREIDTLSPIRTPYSGRHWPPGISDTGAMGSGLPYNVRQPKATKTWTMQSTTDYRRRLVRGGDRPAGTAGSGRFAERSSIGASGLGWSVCVFQSAVHVPCERFLFKGEESTT
ncbi:hypothetical protein ZHAS_00004184 [Anopheles sinensis]|uniref:Uncharacterized protein n=1 Tax=Anopheles sinensis TaxID=74873 RepID=A0A084VGB4_ANOSI|nr:hypothetical protein ZHAS_00004184 [Anopheles sinensis]